MGVEDKLAILGGKKLIDIEKQNNWPIFTEHNIKSVNKILEENITTCYDRGHSIIEDLENKFSNFLNSKHSIFLNSGTTALLLAYYAINLKKGDEVIAPAYTYPGTITPLLHFGAKPILADIENDSFNIDANDIEHRITDKTKAIVVTHMRGLPAEMDKITDICSRHKLKLIEDCSHAIGSQFNNQYVGTFGDFGCFSLSADKIISGGTAGIMITNDDALADSIRQVVNVPTTLDNVKKENEGHVFSTICEIGIGQNFKSNPLTAALVSSQIDEIDIKIKERYDNFSYLTNVLKSKKGIRVPKSRENSTRGGWYGYRIRYIPEELNMLKKDKFIEILKAEGVSIGESRIKPFYKYDVFKSSTDQLKMSFNYDSNILSEINREDYPNTEYMDKWTLKIDIETTENYKKLYEMYALAFDKLYKNLDKLPKDYFMDYKEINNEKQLVLN